jgi:hypothetical protein
MFNKAFNTVDKLCKELNLERVCKRIYFHYEEVIIYYILIFIEKSTSIDEIIFKNKGIICS